ncbi:membrane protein [Candidatus Thiomargarita nelsonii]|uniref:Membrane protein n=1 Tax=Candidatus Thiomargarita nelsonii TaxID=1003181 RepID=A0A176RUF9_9GAMM|nr:membrane protein [Candidatus Thiomargarita nelsonii]
MSELKSDKESWIFWVVWPVAFVSFVISEAELGTGWWNWVVAIFVFFIVFGLLLAFVDAERKLQNHSDEMLELLYNDMERKKSFKNIAISVVIGILLFLIFFSGEDNIWNRITTDAKCSVVSANVTDDSFLISGEPNYGFSVSTILKNSGKDGNVFVHVSLSSSEGDLKRKQTVFMKAGETRSLKYQFVEPTVNATNVRYSVTCTPSSDKNDNSE